MGASEQTGTLDGQRHNGAVSSQAFSEVAGGVCAAKGFAAGGIHAGFRKDPARLDMALVVADAPCAAAGTFTTNRFCAAPVQVSRAHLGAGACYGTARAVVINSGNANAATGEPGREVAEASCAVVAHELGCAPDEVLVASTGVIGVPLPLEPYQTAVPALAGALAAAAEKDASAAPAAQPVSEDNARFSADEAASGVPTAAAAARAIMTTDTVPKECAVSWQSADSAYAGATFSVGGMCKGSGMIMPNMATMIAVVTTDAPVAAPDLRALLLGCVRQTFNKVTVDSDTSTNDTCIALASGAAAPGAEPVRPGTQAWAELEQAVLHVCTALARGIAADGEGATRLVTVNVTGAATPEDADTAARAVANSPLVKTAIFGHDCNWGRIAGALGKCGVPFEQEDVTIKIMGLLVCEHGLTVPFDEDEALRRFEDPEIVIDADLGAGEAATTVWTCDLTHDYVTINGDYRT